MVMKSIPSFVRVVVISTLMASVVQAQERVGSPPDTSDKALSVPVQSYAVLDISSDSTGGSDVDGVALNDDNTAAFFTHQGNIYDPKFLDTPVPSDSSVYLSSTYSAFKFSNGVTTHVQDMPFAIQTPPYYAGYDFDVRYTLGGWVDGQGNMYGEELKYDVLGDEEVLYEEVLKDRNAYECQGGSPTLIDSPLPYDQSRSYEVELQSVNGSSYCGTTIGLIPGYQGPHGGFTGGGFVVANGAAVVFDPDAGVAAFSTSGVQVINDSLIPNAMNGKGSCVGYRYIQQDLAIWDGQSITSITADSVLMHLNDQNQVIANYNDDGFGSPSQSEGFLWENGAAVTLASQLPKALMGQLTNIQPFSISNQVAPGSDATIHILATAKDNGADVHVVCTRDNNGVWSFAEIQLPQGVTPSSYASINSSGVIAAIGDPDGDTGPTAVQHALLLVPVIADSTVAKTMPKYRGSVSNPIICSNQHTDAPDEHIAGALTIYHNDVCNDDGTAADFDVLLKMVPVTSTGILWSQTSGPSSGTLLNSTSPTAILRNPKKGGLYEFQLHVNGQYAATLQVWLLVAGPDVTHYWESEITYFKNVWGPHYQSNLAVRASFVNLLLSGDTKEDLALIDYASIGPKLLWTGEIKGAKTRCTSPIPDSKDASKQLYARYTMYGFTISYSKRNNMIFALIGKEMGLGEQEIILGSIAYNAFAEHTPLGSAATASLFAGFDLYYDVTLAEVMRTRGLAMHDPNGPEDKEWPSDEVTSQGFKRGADALLQKLIQ